MSAVGWEVAIEGERARIGTAAEVVVALDVLQGHHDREVLEQLRGHLPEIIGGPRGLQDVLRVLEPDDKLYLIDALGEELAGLVRDARSLRDILAMLAEEEVECRLLSTIGAEGLRCMIGTAEEASEVLEWVYGDCDELVLELLGAGRLSELARTGEDLATILRSLEPARQKLVIEMLGWESLPGLVQEPRDLAHLLRALPADLSARLLEQITPERVRRLVPDRRAWAELERYLESEEAELLGRMLEVNHCAQ